MKIAILDETAQDLTDGYYFYEKQADNLGSYFLDSLFSDIDSLMIYAGVHTVVFRKYYRLLSKRFLFAVYYTIDDYTIFVHAVLDCRKDPTWIRSKL